MICQGIKRSTRPCSNRARYRVWLRVQKPGNDHEPSTRIARVCGACLARTIISALADAIQVTGVDRADF